MCITPITLKRPPNTSSLERTMVVPCGKCIKCLKRRQNGWAFRLSKESLNSTSACFITLTYSDCPLTPNGLPTLNKKDYQNFMKRLRKQTKAKIKYYACGEYGTLTNRPHYHAIMFNLPPQYLQGDKLANVWSRGHVDIAPCNMATIHYGTKYMLKGGFTTLPDYINYDTGEVISDDRLKEFSLMSKRMGASYLTPAMKKFHKETLTSYITLPGGTATAMPRYFRDQIFSKEELIIINLAAKQSREMNWEKLFDDCHKKHHEWTKNQILKNERKVFLERIKL